MNPLSSKVLTLLTSKRTTIISVIVALILWLAGTDAVQMLTDNFGLTATEALRVTNMAKMLAAILAATGYSVLHKPEETVQPTKIGPDA